MKTYVCHKKVRAARIYQPWSMASVMLEDGEVIWDKPMVRKALDTDMAKANPPGYLVEYADGYQSYSPKGAFEEGYTEVRSTDA